MRIVIVALILVLAAPPGGAEEQARLSSYGEAVAAIRQASVVTLSAYTLPSRGALLTALLATARRPGAHVSVMLDGEPVGAVRRSNGQLAALLAAAGVRVRFSQGPLHMKAIVVDGARVFVSDRNWSSTHSLIIELPAAMRLTVERAILGQSGRSGPFTTRKADALALEAEVLERGSGPILFESESFGASIISEELERQARRGTPVTLVVAAYEYRQLPGEQRLVARLRSAGIRVVVSRATEKLAVRGGLGWAGSSNATAGLPDQIDWGYETTDPALVRDFGERIKSNAAIPMPHRRPQGMELLRARVFAYRGLADRIHLSSGRVYGDGDPIFERSKRWAPARRPASRRQVWPPGWGPEPWGSQTWNDESHDL